MSNAKSKPELIVVKKIKKTGHGHHGGSWKIAYADFVTAMMAFFLVLWLINSMKKSDLEGIAEYFKQPSKVAMTGGEQLGDAASQNEKTPSDSQNDKTSTKDEQQEKMDLEQLKAKIEAIASQDGALNKYKDQILMDLTAEGLRIQIIDKENRPMFATGGVEMADYAKEILDALTNTINAVPNPIAIIGHTDAIRYSSGDNKKTNWELSTERANAARRELIHNKIPESKIFRVIGYGDTQLLDKKDPKNFINRRISILVMKKEAVENVLREEGSAKPIPDKSISDAPISDTLISDKSNADKISAADVGAVPNPHG